jgi:type III secretion protein L
MLILLKDRTGLALEHGILKASEAQAVIDGEEALARARAECADLQRGAGSDAARQVAEATERAREIVACAEAQARQLRQEAQAAIDAAFDDARERGRRDAIQEWHVRHLDAAHRIAGIMDDLNPRLATIVVTAVERMVAESSRQALFDRAFRHVGALTRGATTLSLRVHPDDVQAAWDALAELRQHATIAFEVNPDSALSPGSCLMESELGVIDASLRTQLDALRASFEGLLGITLDASPRPEASAAPYRNGHDPDIRGSDPVPGRDGPVESEGVHDEDSEGADFGDDFDQVEFDDDDDAEAGHGR